jgi:hypothetical protein
MMSSQAISRAGAALIYFLVSFPFVGVVLLARTDQASLSALVLMIGVAIAVIGGATKIGSP